MSYCDFKGNGIAVRGVFILALLLFGFCQAMATTYAFTGNGQWNNAANWGTTGIPPSTLPSGDTIILTPFDYCVLTTDLVIGEGAVFTFNIYRDFQVGDFDITVSGKFNMFGTINSDAGFIMSITATGIVNKDGTIFVNGYLENDGTINDSGGAWNISGMGGINTGAIFLNDYSQIRVDFGREFENSGLIEINDFASIENSGSFTNNGNLQINGSFRNGDIFDPGTLMNNGTIQGAGTLFNDGTIVNSSTGSIEPGLSPGTLVINGNFNFASSTFKVQINGTAQGSTYDLLVVNGTATIDGSSLLDIDFGYSPVLNTSFDILTASSIDGGFDFPSNVSFHGGNVGAIELSYPGGNTMRVTVSGLLPVELVRFDAKVQASQVLLNWKTASERNNKGFSVLRSADAHHWEALGFVDGNGTAFEPHDYAFMDKMPMQGINYYRLEQIDFDNGTDYSPIRIVNLNNDAAALCLFPNPAKYETNLTMDMDYIGEATIHIYEASGKLVARYPVLLSGDSPTKLALPDLVAGPYFLEINGGSIHSYNQLIIR